MFFWTSTKVISPSNLKRYESRPERKLPDNIRRDSRIWNVKRDASEHNVAFNVIRKRGRSIRKRERRF